MRRFAIALVLLISSSSASWGYCVYNKAGGATIRANVRGLGNMDVTIDPGDGKCCNPNDNSGCRGAVAEISLVSDSSVGCTANIQDHGWIEALITDVGGRETISCTSYPQSSLLRDLVEDLPSDEGVSSSAEESEEETSYRSDKGQG